MKKSEIQFEVELDDKNIPENIRWKATDGPSNEFMKTKAININVWDPKQNNTLSMSLWDKEMTTYDMKRFFIEALDAMAETVQNATGDTKMADIMRRSCETLVAHVNNEHAS